MIVIPMMDRQFVKVFTSKLSRTSTANPCIHTQRFFSISAFALLSIPARLGDNSVELRRIAIRFLIGHRLFGSRSGAPQYYCDPRGVGIPETGSPTRAALRREYGTQQ